MLSGRLEKVCCKLKKKNSFNPTIFAGSMSSPKPVAAPRQFLLEEKAPSPVGVNRNPSTRSSLGEVINKAQSSGEFGDVQLRRTELLEQRPAKPEIPARPATLAPIKRYVSQENWTYSTNISKVEMGSSVSWLSAHQLR